MVHVHNGVFHCRKNNDILNFAGKWIQLESTILCEVTQTQKDNYHMYSLINGFKHKTKKISLQITVPENLDKNEDSKRDMHRSNLHGKKKKTRSPEKIGSMGTLGEY